MLKIFVRPAVIALMLPAFLSAASTRVTLKKISGHWMRTRTTEECVTLPPAGFAPVQFTTVVRDQDSNDPNSSQLIQSGATDYKAAVFVLPESAEPVPCYNLSGIDSDIIKAGGLHEVTVLDDAYVVLSNLTNGAKLLEINTGIDMINAGKLSSNYVSNQVVLEKFGNASYNNLVTRSFTNVPFRTDTLKSFVGTVETYASFDLSSLVLYPKK